MKHFDFEGPLLSCEIHSSKSVEIQFLFLIKTLRTSASLGLSFIILVVIRDPLELYSNKCLLHPKQCIMDNQCEILDHSPI